MAEPSSTQVRHTRAVVEWYLTLYYRSGDDPGLPQMFCDPARVGSFALDERALEEGDPETLFRLLVAIAMFQRRQDVQILRILKGMGAEDAAELSNARTLLRLVDQSSCEHMKSLAALREGCDLTKDAFTKTGTCAAKPGLACHMKRHTVALKRWGHFGKMPTSVALSLRESGAGDLRELRRAALRQHRDPLRRAKALEEALGTAWRVSQKIACMFLSSIANPAFLANPPWRRGVDWTHFVVVDSNVDLFLKAVGYAGTGTYDARRDFVQRLAARIDLSELHPDLDAYNPRVVQQALYLFMSAANRRSLARDCSKTGPEACRRCPRALATRCALRSRSLSRPRA